MSLGDELARFRHHSCFVFAAQIQGVTKTDNVDAGFAHGKNGLEIMQLGAIGIILSGLDQVGLGIHLDQIIDFGIVSRIASDQTALAGQNAANALGSNFEQMLGIEVGGIFTVEIAIEMLHLLIACEQHQTTGFARGGHVVVDVRFAGLGRYVDGHLHLITSDLGHDIPP